MPHIDPSQWIADYGYLAVFLIVFMETAGVPLPGEITLILAGVAAHRGSLDLVPLIVVGSLAAILGDNVGYLIGRYGGRRVVLRLAQLRPRRLDARLGRAVLRQHGGKTVFLARWTAGLRIFGAWIAGMTHMPWRTFFIWNAAGGITWVTAAVMAGYVFSGSVARIESLFGTGGEIAGGRSCSAAACSTACASSTTVRPPPARPRWPLRATTAPRAGVRLRRWRRGRGRGRR